MNRHNITLVLRWAYTRERRWSSQLNFNSSLASNSDSNLTTRNQTDINMSRLLRWNNWFYTGTASFLQSSVQGINLQTTLAGGIGRYLKKHQSSEYRLDRGDRLAERKLRTENR